MHSCTPTQGDSTLYRVVCNFTLFLVLNILWFSVADTRMHQSSQNIHTVIDATLYVIHRIFNRQNIQHQQVLVRIYLSSLFDIQLLRKSSSFVGRFIDRSVGAYFFAHPLDTRRVSISSHVRTNDWHLVEHNYQPDSSTRQQQHADCLTAE